MKAKLVKESLNEDLSQISPAVIDDFQKLAAELEKRRIPCKIQLSEFGGTTEIDVICGWDYPDSLFDKISDIMDYIGIQASVSADASGGKIIASKRIAGGPKEYKRGRR